VLIIHGTLITLGRSDQLIEDGGLRITDDLITAVGPSEELLARYPGEETLHAAGMLIMPGLIDAHTHTHRIIFRGATLEREDRLPRNWDEILDYETIRYATLAHCIEALRNGVTTLFHEQTAAQTIHLSLDAVAEPILQAGLRAMVCSQVSDRVSLSHARQAVEENARFARLIQQEKLLACSMGLDACSMLSNDSMRAAVGTAAVVDIGFHVDVAARRDQPRECINRYGMRPVERLRRFGALGPRTVGTNCLYLAPEEMDLLHRHGGCVVHTPRSNALGDLGQAPLCDLWDRGLTVGLGTDGIDSSLWAEMQAAYMLSPHTPGSPGAITPGQVGQMLLHHNGAIASRIFRAKLGELAVGALADILLVRYPHPTPLTRDSLRLHLLWGHAGCRVDTIFVGGKALLRHGELLTLDEDAVLGHCRALAERAWARA
jgi:cytosine/adenosine deaminase-related metal-dependent hydrolase